MFKFLGSACDFKSACGYDGLVGLYGNSFAVDTYNTKYGIMKKIMLNGKVVRVYDSIDEMPIVNFQKYNKYLLIDSGIGSDVDDIDAHVVNIARFIKAGNANKALMELQNLRQNLHMVNSEISPKYLSFAALIHSVDGKEITDLSDDNLKEVLQELKQLKHSFVADFIEWLKKKVATELETYFPEEFNSAREKEAYDVLKRRTLLILDSIVNGTDTEGEVAAIDKAAQDKYKPKMYVGSDSVEVKYDRNFESTCLLITQETNADAKRMTVLQFYNAVDNIKKQAEAKMKSLKRAKNGR